MKMLIHITCNNCGKGKGINYKFEVTEWEEPCNKCGEHKYSEKTFNFCSLRCSRLYIAKLEKHKCNEHYACRGLELEKDMKKIKKAWVACEVCHKLEFVSYKKGMKIKGMENYLRWKH